jgi:aminomethyltransferase
MPKVRRRSGARGGGFPGAEVVLQQLDTGPAKRRVGLRPRTRTPIRAGALLFAGPATSDPIGRVTSGGFGPSLGGPLAMGYVPLASATRDAGLFAEVRGTRIPVEVTDLPFVPHRYKRT